MLGALFGFKGRLSRPGFWEVVFSIVLVDVLLLLASMYVADSGLPGGFGPSSGPSLALLSAAPWVLVVFTVWSLLDLGCTASMDEVDAALKDRFEVIFGPTFEAPAPL